MTQRRYDLIPRHYWPWQGPAYKGLDADLATVEAAIDDLQAAVGVRHLLPLTGPAPDGIIRTINRITFNSSTKYPIPATWTDPTLLSIRIVNPTDSPSSLNIGLGTYGSANHTTEPDVVAPGQEWVTGATAVPVFVRASTDGAYVTPVIITERSA